MMQNQDTVAYVDVTILLNQQATVNSLEARESVVVEVILA